MGESLDTLFRCQKGGGCCPYGEQELERPPRQRGKLGIVLGQGVENRYRAGAHGSEQKHTMHRKGQRPRTLVVLDARGALREPFLHLRCLGPALVSALRLLHGDLDISHRGAVFWPNGEKLLRAQHVPERRYGADIRPLGGFRPSAQQRTLATAIWVCCPEKERPGGRNRDPGEHGAEYLSRLPGGRQIPLGIRRALPRRHLPGAQRQRLRAARRRRRQGRQPGRGGGRERHGRGSRPVQSGRRASGPKRATRARGTDMVIWGGKRWHPERLQDCDVTGDRPPDAVCLAGSCCCDWAV